MSELFEPIAVIGMAGKFPGARDIQEYWHNLSHGVESVTFPSDEQLLARGVTPEELADPAYVKAVALPPDVDMFDAEFFGLTPRDAEICDPQLRVFLEVVHATIEDAGYDTSRVGDGIGVFGATGPSRYGDLYVMNSDRYPKEPLNLWTLNNVDYLSTLASYKLNLRGPSFTMATACSSSLVALHLACQSLRVGECDAAITGGSAVNLPYGHGHHWAPGGVRSPDGHCRPFDVSGGGTIFGNGAAAVMLKRLSDAVADGDHVRAVIRGTAINNDGADKVSFSAPSVTGQAAAIMEAMVVAGVSPLDISYVEAHATGTALGDPVEVAALTTAYRNIGPELPPPGSIGLGSVKSNIGHLVWAAGVASLIKVVLSLENEQLPASLHFSAPNPKLGLEQTPFYVNHSRSPWPRRADRPRLAGISSLGIGGTNAHVVVAEAPQRAAGAPSGRPRIVVWSGRDAAATAANRGKLAEYFAGPGEETFGDAVATLQQGRRGHRVREAAVCATAAEAADALRRKALITASGGPADQPRGLVFQFPGQGAQHRRMAAGLYGAVPVFTETVDLCLELFERQGIQLYDRWLAEDGDEILRQTRYAQPLLFLVEYALAETWSSWGVRPDAVLGHSIGELVAATVAGVFDIADAARLVAVRAESMQAMPAGGMLAVAMTEEDVRALLPASLAVSAVNPGGQTVIGGPLRELSALADRLRSTKVSTRMLRTSHAFHTGSMREAVDRFAEAFAGVRPRPSRLPLYSAATGARLTDAEAVDPAFWAGQLVKPVRYAAAVDAAVADIGGVLLEVGPGRGLTRLVGRHAGVRARLVPVASLGPPDQGPAAPRDDERDLLTAVARLWVEGVPVDWVQLNRGEPVQRVPVPGYQFQRKRYWVEPVRGQAAPRSAQQAAQPDRVPGHPPVSTSPGPDGMEASASSGPSYTTTTWVEQPRARLTEPQSHGRCALALVPARHDDAGPPVVAALQQAGYEVIRVRPGSSFMFAGDECVVRPAAEADHGLLVDALAGQGRRPDLVVHAWSIPAWVPATAQSADAQLDLAFFSLLALVQRLGRKPGAQPRVMVLTTRSLDISGNEATDPVKAALHGVVRTLALEAPAMTPRVVDVGPRVGEDELIEELLMPDGPPVVALRGTRRWVPVERPCAVDGAGTTLRREGVYLITGGLGGLGLAVAKGLAATGKRPRLALLGRNGPTPAAAEAISELEELGAQVRVVTADVTDARAVRRALDIVQAHFGPVDGVLHLAGVPGDGMLHLRRPADASNVLRPKVHGTLVLAESLRCARPLDFFVSFSSLAALHGLVGSADYAAGNAFLDAWAACGDEVASRHLSINWPAWTEVGMAAGNTVPTPAARRPATGPAADPPPDERVDERILSADGCWALDEHRFGGQAVLPGTGHLDLVVGVFRQFEPDAAGKAIVLEEAVFEKPLTGDVAREVRIGFTTDGERQRFQVTSRPHGSGEPWQRHVSGYIGIAEREQRKLPVDEYRRRLPPQPTPSFVPTPSTFLALGPRWQGTSGMWAENGTKLLHIRLPEPFAGDLPDHPLHPAIMDLATALIRDRDRDAPHLPFLYRRLVLHNDLPAEVLSYIRRRPDTEGVIVGDIDVLAPDGTVLVEIEGFTMRVLRDLSVVAGEAAAGFADLVPPAEARPVASDGATGNADDLDPRAGVRAFMALLAGRTPEQVAVRRSPGPVPAVAPAVPPEHNREPSRPPAAPAAERPPAGAAAPVSSVEDRLRAIWREAIGIDDIGRSADFFDIGGDSLTAVQLMGRVREQFGVELSIGILFDHPTLGGLTDVITEQLVR
ncbi:SDR family NAD(P)-dependent oxidoreductase [Dactylosporangium roseum]|uniref:SDR family NAD(P)-dependent oxidoreductase n=1 Tax=Dactylosporangium roseum TaxID=47989 RepID=A0ABY5ZBJ5_9ACTN|nr:type I polyketide synthase [Dactylosporangium roseum]UWZ39429.1 SDR family NAD(P)-dependent oxidoreductase [Dactylosporangium roseum]